MVFSIFFLFRIVFKKITHLFAYITGGNDGTLQNLKVNNNTEHEVRKHCNSLAALLLSFGCKEVLKVGLFHGFYGDMSHTDQLSVAFATFWGFSLVVRGRWLEMLLAKVTGCDWLWLNAGVHKAFGNNEMWLITRWCGTFPPLLYQHLVLYCNLIYVSVFLTLEIT